jgi:hypothetical protein
LVNIDHLHTKGSIVPPRRIGKWEGAERTAQLKKSSLGVRATWLGWDVEPRN